MKNFFFYSFTRSFIGFKIPIAIQNVYLRDFAKRNELEFSLAFPEEPRSGSYSILKDISNKCNDDDSIIAVSLFILEELTVEHEINFDVTIVGILENKAMKIREAIEYIHESKELGELSVGGNLS